MPDTFLPAIPRDEWLRAIAAALPNDGSRVENRHVEKAEVIYEVLERAVSITVAMTVAQEVISR